MQGDVKGPRECIQYVKPQSIDTYMDVKELSLEKALKLACTRNPRQNYREKSQVQTVASI